MSIKIFFKANLRILLGTDFLSYPEGSIPLLDIINHVFELYKSKNKNKSDSELIFKNPEDFYAKMLILVNDKDISVLNDRLTKLKSGDEVVFLPIIHGG
jgi:molybdopterin converting factor small subunit